MRCRVTSCRWLSPTGVGNVGFVVETCYKYSTVVQYGIKNVFDVILNGKLGGTQVRHVAQQVERVGW